MAQFGLCTTTAYHAEGFVCSGDHGSPVLSHRIWLFSELLLLLFGVDGVVARFARPTKMLRRRDAIVDPRRPSDKVHDSCTWQLGHLRHNLNARGTVSDDSDALVRVIEVVVPVGRVDTLTFEVLQALDVGPLVSAVTVACQLALAHTASWESIASLKNPLSVDQNVRPFVPPLLSLLDRHLPLATIFILTGPSDPSIELNVSIEVPLLGGLDDILLDLCAARIKPSPFWIRIERESLI